MMPLLADLPAGRNVMVDANVLIYALAHEPTFGDPSRDFVNRVLRGEVSCVATVAQLAEVLHRLLLSEAASMHGFPQQGLLRRLQKSPDLVRPLHTHAESLKQLVQSAFEVIEVSQHHLWNSHALRQTHGLLVNDSILLAVMLDQGLTDLVTQDSDFDTVPGITVWKPVL
ncbi:MAG: type II toxin-antitoxin system VapC family toxin [Planctomycetaceae bacterium]